MLSGLAFDEKPRCGKRHVRDEQDKFSSSTLAKLVAPDIRRMELALRVHVITPSLGTSDLGYY